MSTEIESHVPTSSHEIDSTTHENPPPAQSEMLPPLQDNDPAQQIASIPTYTAVPADTDLSSIPRNTTFDQSTMVQGANEPIAQPPNHPDMQTVPTRSETNTQNPILTTTPSLPPPPINPLTEDVQLQSLYRQAHDDSTLSQQKYLSSFPAIRNILSDWLAWIILKKPDDIYEESFQWAQSRKRND